jgi:hypothetical protein
MTMSATTLPTSDDLHPDEEQLAGYVAISRPAVGALLLGLASPLILVSPLLVVIPLAGIAVATVALRSIAASRGQQKGYWMATIGLCLATLFFGWGVTRQLSRQSLLVAEAEQFASGWLQLAREGKLQEADQLMRESVSRIRNPAALAEYYQENREARENMQALFSREPLKSFRLIGPQGTFRFASIAGQSRHGNTDEVVLKYVYAGSDGAEPRSLWIRISREARAGTADWMVRTVEDRAPGET